MVVSRMSFVRGAMVRGFPPRIGVRGRLCAGMTKWGRGNDEFRLWPVGGGLRNPAQGAHKGRAYGDVGRWWDAGVT